MSHIKTAVMLQTLVDKTAAGKVIWAETEQSGAFQTSFPNYSVRIFEAQNFENTTDFVLQITNADGDVVEEVRDPELTEFFEKPYVVMRDLHESARRRAMGVDDALDEILRSLKGA